MPIRRGARKDRRTPSPSTTRWRRPGSRWYFEPGSQKFTLIDTCFGRIFAVRRGSGQHLVLQRPGWHGRRLAEHETVRSDRDEQHRRDGARPCSTPTATGRIQQTVERVGVGRGTGDEDTAASRIVTFDPKRDTRSLGALRNHRQSIDGALWGATDEVKCRPDLPPRARQQPTRDVQEPNVTAAEGARLRPRGIDVDRNGVIWTALRRQRSYGQLRPSKCATLAGATTRDGLHCAEGDVLQGTVVRA